MLRRSISYKMLLRLAGFALLLYGLFWVVRALFEQVDVGGVVQYHGPLLFWPTGYGGSEIVNYIFFGYPLLENPVLGGWFDGFVVPGPLLYASIGLCLLALSTLRPWLVYGSLQVVLWLGSMSFWSGLAMAFSYNGTLIPDSVAPYFWITLVCSLVLLAAYYPVLVVLKKLCLPPTSSPPERDVLTRNAAP